MTDKTQQSAQDPARAVPTPAAAPITSAELIANTDYARGAVRFPGSDKVARVPWEKASPTEPEQIIPSPENGEKP